MGDVAGDGLGDEERVMSGRLEERSLLVRLHKDGDNE